MGKETSSQVSSIATRIMRTPEAANDPMVEAVDYNSLLEDAKVLARAYMGADETPGHDFLSRLKNERRNLEDRLTTLNSYLTHNPGRPNPGHNEMLTRQAKIMSEFLAVLDERLADIATAAEDDGA